MQGNINRGLTRSVAVVLVCSLMGCVDQNLLHNSWGKWPANAAEQADSTSRKNRLQAEGMSSPDPTGEVEVHLADFQFARVADPDLTFPQEPIDSERNVVASAPGAPIDAVPKASSLDDSENKSAETGMPIEYFVAEALASNPQIFAARQKVAAAVNRIPQARALTDPMLTETFWPFHGNSLQTAGGRAANQIGFMQAVPWPEKLDARAAIACREVQVARAEVAKVGSEVMEAVKLACAEIIFAQEALAILEENSQLVDELTEIAEARYRSGGSQQDILRVQRESDRIDDQRVQLIKQLRLATADLAAQLHRPLDDLPRVASDSAALDETALTTQLENFVSLAEQCNPSLRGLASQVAVDREKQRLARLQGYPDFQLGLNWLMVSEQDAISRVANGNDNFGLSVGLSLPIWKDKIEAGVREAHHQTSGSAQRLQAERDTVYSRIRRLAAQADSLMEQQQIYSERLLPRTNQTLELTLADYRGQRSDFFSVVETYRELLMLELQLARIRATLVGTLATLERTVGCEILPK